MLFQKPRGNVILWMHKISLPAYDKRIAFQSSFVLGRCSGIVQLYCQVLLGFFYHSRITAAKQGTPVRGADPRAYDVSQGLLSINCGW